MSNLLHVSAAPHARSKTTTKQIMRDVLIALLPATVFGMIYFGLNAVLVVIASVATAVATEYVYEKSDEAADHDCGLFRCSYRSADRDEYAAGNSILDADAWQYFCNHRSKDAVRWSGSELHEPGTGSKMFPDDFLCKVHDGISGGCNDRCDTAGSFEARGVHLRSGFVLRYDSRNHR